MLQCTVQCQAIIANWLVAYRLRRAYIFAKQAGDITWSINGNSIKRTDKARFLRADCDTRSTIDAGIPTNVENDGFKLTHIFLYSELGSK